MVAIQERTVRVWQDKVKPRVKVAGERPPLVFFHGAYGLVWDPFLDTLAQSHTVYAQEFASRIANARVEIVDRAAHVPQLEQLELVSKLVQDFLKS